MLDTILWKSGDVNRWHANADYRLRNSCDTNAAHSFRVMMLMDRLFPDASKDELRQAMYHDTPEVVTGDTPHTTKAEYGDPMKQIESAVRTRFDIPEPGSKKVKLCDSIDAIMWMKNVAPDLRDRNDWIAHRNKTFAIAREFGSEVSAKVERLIS